MAEPLDALYASDGVAPAVRATISSTRLPTDMAIITDSVANWPFKGIATSGTPDVDGVIIPSTVCVFTYVLTGTIIHITGFAPGYYDVGHTEGQICILKPTTYHNDSLIEAIENKSSLPVGGTTGQTLIKASNIEGDVAWGAPAGNSSWVFNITPAGLINGTNATFTLPDSASNAIVVLNGLVLKPGVGNDYDLTGATLTLTAAPVSGSNLIVSYTASTSAMTDGSSSWVPQETPSGLVNGTDKVYTTQQPYIGGTLEVYINGIRQRGITHFVETSPSAGTFTMDDAPVTGDLIFVTYQFARSVAANADTVDNIHASALPQANTLLPLDSNASLASYQEDWQSPTLTNSWVGYTAPYSTPKYMKDRMGFVHFKGLIKNGTMSATAFTLPAGYRPSDTLVLACISNSTIGCIEVTSSGLVKPVVGSNIYVALDGLTFKAEG